MRDKKLSIIIVSYNTKDCLCDCLQSILGAAVTTGYEAIVVDNASPDGSAGMVRKDFPWARLIENKDNSGFAKANNQGIAVSAGEYILLLNSDTILSEKCLDRSVEYMDGHPEAGIMGCKVFNKNGIVQRTAYGFPGILSETVFFTVSIMKPVNGFFIRHRPVAEKDANDACVDVISGCFLMARKKVFENAGYLDEGFFMYYEDTEFAWRVRKAGYKAVYFKDASIVHLGGASGETVRNEMMFHCYRSACRYFMCTGGKMKKIFFMCMCRSVWLIELVVLCFFLWNQKASKKAKLLLGLYRI